MKVATPSALKVATPSARSRMGRSRVAGVPTTVAPSGPSEHQLALPFDAATGAGATRTSGRREVLPEVVHVAGWLTPMAQQALVAQFRQWACPPAGLRHPRVPNGQLMSVQSVCLGWHWQPYAYSRTADDTDHSQVKPLPEEIADLGRAAVIDAYGAGTDAFTPDAAIVNLYVPGARLGLHQDGEEPSGRAGCHDQPGRHVRLPAGRRRPAYGPVHRRDPVLR